MPERAADQRLGELPQFFISRTGADKAIAIEIAGILTHAGHRVLIQDEHFDHRNFMGMMDAGLASGARVVAVLSEDYLKSEHCALEWYHPLADDPLNTRARLIVMRVKECVPAGYLKAIAYWDLVKVRGEPALLEAAVLGAIDPAARERPSLAQYWQAPGVVVHDRIRATPGFTGRGEEIAEIDKALWARETPALTQSAAVQGFGGVGKSTIAKEYAWRVSEYPDVYAGIWWLDAEKARDAESWPGLETGYVALGDVFIRGLAQQKDRPAAARTGRDFIEKAGFALPWLLIYDNVDDVRALTAWPPPKGAHVIVTSRMKAGAPGMTPVVIESWPLQDAVSYLKANSSRADITDAQAEAIATALGCLPLALAHAAAYLADNDNASPESYLAAVRQHMRDVPESALAIAPRAVFATLQENIAQAETRAPGAAAVMALAAFYAPDAIPEELFRQEAEHYPAAFAELTGEGPALEKAIGALSRLSLVVYDRASKTFNVHRLVQAAARDGLGAEAGAWSEAAVKAANAAFPADEFNNWPTCARLLPHAVTAMSSCGDALGVPLANLAGNVAGFIYERAEFDLAESLFKRSLAIREKALGPDHPDVSTSLNNLALLYEAQGKYDLAEPLFKRSLESYEKALDADHPYVASALNNLAFLYEAQGKYDLAEPHYERSLAIWENALGPDHPDVGASLNNLAELYREQGKYDLAEPLYQRSLTISEKALGPGHPLVGSALNNFALLYEAQGKYDLAFSLYQRSFTIREKALGPDHPDVGTSLNNLAGLNVAQGKYDLAEPLFKRSLAIREKALGPDHPDVGGALNNLAILLYRTDRKREALDHARRAHAILLRALGAEHPETQNAAQTLATIAADLGEPGP
jgi:tetratricopeptide (TPR) repeat protein